MNDTYANGARVSIPLGSILDRSSNMLLKMWYAEVPSGKLLFQHHSHICFEITVVDSGSGIYTTNSGDLPMQKGDIFIFSSNEYHCITEVGSEGLGLTNIHFEPRYLWGAPTDSFSEANINLCFYHSKNFSNRIEAAKGENIIMLVNQIKNELKNKPTEYQLQIKSLINLLLIGLVREFSYSDKTTWLNSTRFKNIQHILNYIDQHFTEKLSLNELSKLAGMSPNYFSSFFKKTSGIPLWDYINQKRIDLSVQILRERDSGKNILEIATLCGFNNTAHFNKTFKKVTGMTPTEYRKNTNLMIH